MQNDQVHPLGVNSEKLWEDLFVHCFVDNKTAEFAC